MSIRIQHCIVIVCDCCGSTGEDDDGGPIHFNHLDEATKWLASDDDVDDPHRWLMTPTEHVCPDCRRKRACALVGHPWSEWRQVDVRGIPMMVRTCWDCMEREIAAPEVTA